jgi:hypothetical protein
LVLQARSLLGRLNFLIGAREAFQFPLFLMVLNLLLLQKRSLDSAAHPVRNIHPPNLDPLFYFAALPQRFARQNLSLQLLQTFDFGHALGPQHFLAQRTPCHAYRPVAI